VLWPYPADVYPLKLGGAVWWNSDSSRGYGKTCGGHARRFGSGVIDSPRRLVDNLDLDGRFGAGVDARGFKAVGEAAMAHVTLADNASRSVELRNRIGTIPDAVLTTDASVCRVEDDSRKRVFRISVDRAPFDAVGIQAVITTHGEVVTPRVGVDPPLDLTNASPKNVRGIPILLVACDFAGTASDALCHIEVKAVLLTFGQRAIRDQLRAEGR
jgi:hypothetical protein